jgi:hypothetical protein
MRYEAICQKLRSIVMHLAILVPVFEDLETWISKLLIPCLRNIFVISDNSYNPEPLFCR